MSFKLHAPPAFAATDDDPGQGLWAFTKFRQAHYDVKLDLKPMSTGGADRGTAHVTAKLEFDVFEESRPVIEFMASMTSTTKPIDVLWTSVMPPKPITPRMVQPIGENRRTQFFGLDALFPVGTHTVEIEFETPLCVRSKTGFSFMRDYDPGVYWFFRMSDARPKHRDTPADDCNFLGRYLPTNLEFDAHRKTIKLELVSKQGSVGPLSLFTNGKIGKKRQVPYELIAGDTYEIEFPEDFTSSSVFFYLGDKSLIETVEVPLPPINGERNITIFGRREPETGTPPDGYETDPRRYAQAVDAAATTVLGDFNRPFSMEKIILYSGRQGMEYAGAAEFSGGNLLHELFHLFIGRFVAPADGRSGWWDEALAHWYVSGMNSYGTPPDQTSSMGAGSPYRRWTSEEARTIGPMLIGFLDHRLPSGKKMQPFLRHLVSGTSIEILDTKQFGKALEAFSGKPFRKHIRRYVLGR